MIRKMPPLHLPLDYVFVISDYLPLRDLPSFLLVCREWHRLDRYDMFWKAHLWNEVVSSIQNMLHHHPSFPYSLADVMSAEKGKKVKIPTFLRNDLSVLVDFPVLERLVSFYKSNFVLEKIMRRETYKKLIDSEDEEVFGSRFKHLTMQYVTNLLPATIQIFFTQVEGHKVFSKDLLQIIFQKEYEKKEHTELMLANLRKFARFNAVQEYKEKLSVQKCSELFLSIIVNDETFSPENLELVLKEYNPTVTWDFIALYLRTHSEINLLIDHCKRDRFGEMNKLNPPTIDKLCRVCTEKCAFNQVYRFVSQVFGEGKWDEIRDSINKRQPIERYFLNLISLHGKEALIQCMELMNVKKLDVSGICYDERFASVLSYLWKERKILTDENLYCIFHTTPISDISLLEELYHYCLKHVENFNLFERQTSRTELNFFQSSLFNGNSHNRMSIVSVFNLFFGCNGKLNWENMNIPSNEFYSWMAYFITECLMFDTNVAMKELTCLYDRMEPNIFDITLLNKFIDSMVYRFSYRYGFHREVLAFVLSLFTVPSRDGMVNFVEQAIRLKQGSLSHLSTIPLHSHQIYEEGSDERLLAIYLKLEPFLRPYQPEEE